jgi:hypothetical protein
MSISSLRNMERLIKYKLFLPLTINLLSMPLLRLISLTNRSIIQSLPSKTDILRISFKASCQTAEQ